ncbi:hypothetical protein QTP88_028175 [Uroleucon formosanum]
MILIFLLTYRTPSYSPLSPLSPLSPPSRDSAALPTARARRRCETFRSAGPRRHWNCTTPTTNQTVRARSSASRRAVLVIVACVCAFRQCCAPKVEIGAVAIVNKVYPSVFANDTANALDCTDYATGANKVKFLFAVIFPSTRTALCPCQVIEWLIYFRNDLSFPLVFPRDTEDYRLKFRR